MKDNTIQDRSGATAQRIEREMTEVEAGRDFDRMVADARALVVRFPSAEPLSRELTKRQQAVMDVITAHPGLDADSIACVLDSQTVAIERIVQGLYLLGQITTERGKHARDEYYARPIR